MLLRPDVHAPRSRLSRLAAIAALASLLAGCTSALDPYPPGADEGVGVSWQSHDVPLFEETGAPYALAWGDGAFWALTAKAHDFRSAPSLLTSADGVSWERVDLQALGLPETLRGHAVLAGTSGRIAVVFQDLESRSLTDGLPWVLVRTGGTWNLTAPSDIEARHLVNQGGDYTIYFVVGAVWIDDALKATITTLWAGDDGVQPHPIGFSELTVSDSSATVTQGELVYQGEPPWFRAISASVTDGESLSLFAITPSLSDTDDLALELASWQNGTEWALEPIVAERLTPSSTVLRDAAAGPSAMVAVGSEVRSAGDVESAVVLRRAEAAEWERIPLPMAAPLVHVVATEQGFYAFSDRRQPSVWFSANGRTWVRLDAPGPRATTAVLALSEGLLVSSEKAVHLSGTVVVPADSEGDAR